MYFDFDDSRPTVAPLGGAITVREGVLLSIIGFLLSAVVHLVFIIVAIMAPRLLSNAELNAAREERARQMAVERERNAERFVFVAPRRDVEALRPPPTRDLSDKDRAAQAPERAPDPANPLPFSRGNSPERVEEPPAQPPPAAPPGQEGRDATPSPAPRAQEREASQPSGSTPIPSRAPGNASSAAGAPRASSGLRGSIADALQNIQRYGGGEVYDNRQGGGGAFGPAIQFDTKGVEFGPWIRRFVAQIKRNWMIPYAAMAMRGHVVLTFNVHRDGRITDLAVAGPCDVEAFNNAAFNAMVMSNPTHPLPAEYPADSAFFTVTFYYNEGPPGL